MDILLINTPSLPLSGQRTSLPIYKQERVSVAPPLGICYLSAYLKSIGHKVKLLDLEVELHSNGDAVSLIKERMDVDLVGISCLISTRHKQAHEIAGIVKSFKDVPIVMGGNYPTNSARQVLEDGNVDFVVMGEGEKIFANLVSSLKTPQEVSGIGYKSDGVKINPRQDFDFVEDLDLLPFPDYDSLPLEKYFSIHLSQSLAGNFRFFTIFSSRGCPRNCMFCGAHNIFGRRFRHRSVSNVLGEVDWLRRTYGVEELQFQDDNLTLDRQYSEALLDGLRKRSLPWTIPNGLDTNTLDKDLLRKIKQSGGRDICIAVESGNPRVLRMIHKHIDLEKIRGLVGDMRDLGLYSKAFYILGFPGETKEEMQDTIDYARSLKTDWSMFSVANPLPGTEMYELAKSKGYIVGGMEDIGYSNANMRTEDFTPQEVEDLVNKANTEINFLNNYNLNGGNLTWAIRDFKRIATRYPQHTVARDSLKRALKLYEEENPPAHQNRKRG